MYKKETLLEQNQNLTRLITFLFTSIILFEGLDAVGATDKFVQFIMHLFTGNTSTLPSTAKLQRQFSDPVSHVARCVNNLAADYFTFLHRAQTGHWTDDKISLKDLERDFDQLWKIYQVCLSENPEHTKQLTHSVMSRLNNLCGSSAELTEICKGIAYNYRVCLNRNRHLLDKSDTYDPRMQNNLMLRGHCTLLYGRAKNLDVPWSVLQEYIKALQIVNPPLAIFITSLSLLVNRLMRNFLQRFAAPTMPFSLARYFSDGTNFSQTELQQIVLHKKVLVGGLVTVIFGLLMNALGLGIISFTYSAIDERVWEYLCTFLILLISVIQPEILDIFLHMLNWFKETWQRRQNAWQGELFNLAQEYFTIDPITLNWEQQYNVVNDAIDVTFTFNLSDKDHLQILPIRSEIEGILRERFNTAQLHFQLGRKCHSFRILRTTTAINLGQLSADVTADIADKISEKMQQRNITFATLAGQCEMVISAADLVAESEYLASWEGGQPYQKAVEQPSIPSTLQQRSQRRGARIMASAAMMRVLRVYAEQQNQDPRTSQPNYASCIWNIPVCIQKFFAAPQVAITNLNLQVQANSSGDVFAICVDKIHRLTGITQANVDQAKAAFVEDAERFFIKRGSKGYQVLSQRCSVGGTALQMYELNYGVSDCRLYGVALKPTNGAQKPLIVLCILGKALHAGAAQHHRIFDNIRDIINAPTLTRTD